MKDLEGRFTYANSIAVRIMGRPSAQIMGRTLHEMYPADVADALSANDRRAITPGRDKPAAPRWTRPPTQAPYRRTSR